MFTGLIEAVGEVVRHEAPRLVVRPPAEGMGEPWVLGESIAINGCCLTLVDFSEDLAFDLSEETYARTNLDQLAAGTPVNLERAMRVGDRLGGHMVQGHVDTTGTLVSLEPSGDGWTMTVQAPAEDAALLVDKGSVTVDGISLTVVEPDATGRFQVAVIPHTFAHTHLRAAQPGQRVNLEFDIIAKQVVRYLQLRQG